MREKLLLSIVLLAVLATACTPKAPQQAAQVEEPAKAVNADSANNGVAGDFEIKLYQGQDVYGSDVLPISTVFAQGKPVVIAFYAGMCPTCIVELPRLQTACDKYEGQVNFVLVDIGPFVGLGSELDGANMLSAVKAEIPGGTPLSVEVIRDYGVLGTPSAFFFHADGTLSLQHAGLMTEEHIDETIAGLLQ